MHIAKPLLTLLALFFSLKIAAQIPEIQLETGGTITESCRVAPMQYRLADLSGGDLFLRPRKLANLSAAVSIEGENITVDFQNASLLASEGLPFPSDYAGLALKLRGKNITVRNLQVRGYKVALLADSVQNLRIENCDFSYNYRQRLRSGREREDFSDWLSHHQNERDEWLRYGAAIYLKACSNAIVTGCKVTGGQNALLMSGCNDGLVYNNTFQFNSGLGIGLYRSSRNRVMHNKLDWNVRGYSHGFYQRGQDSAGILVYEQSKDNTFAYNSATHSGDGFFLWAGQQTMDSGEGGCNDNLIFENDFSHAPTNGIEVTFSRNKLIRNKIEECTYGIWGGYSYESLILGNLIRHCKTGLAIEHGQQNTVRQNYFDGDSTGINFWAREKQPDDWAYAKKRDTRSRDNVIDRNVFVGCPNPLKMSNTENTAVNGENAFSEFESLLEMPKPNKGLKFLRNDVYGDPKALESLAKSAPELEGVSKVNFARGEATQENLLAPLDMEVAELEKYAPKPLPDGMKTDLPAGFPRGRQFIIVDEWGPFDFRRPLAVLESIAPVDGQPGILAYVFTMLGPSGDWRISKMRGFESVSAQRGTVPGQFVAYRDSSAEELSLQFEFVGPQGVTTFDGQKIPAGEMYKFEFQRFEKKLNWDIAFYNYDAATDPTKNERAFEILKSQKPAAQQKSSDLYFAWWGSPAPGVAEDRFATRASASFTIAPGNYKFELTSDDGVRLWLDGQLVIDHVRPHEPDTQEFSTALKGKHTLEIEHFDVDGFSTLDFRIKSER